jgi:hypothetical protein
MSPSPAHKLAHEFCICVTLSFFIILGAIHAFLHLLHLYFASAAFPSSRLAKIFVAPAVQIAQISQIHEYLLVVFKVTFACSILVFAVREIVALLGSWMGWWNLDSQNAGETGDVEAGAEQNVNDFAYLGWREDEKVSFVPVSLSVRQALTWFVPDTICCPSPPRARGL